MAFQLWIDTVDGSALTRTQLRSIKPFTLEVANDSVRKSLKENIRVRSSPEHRLFASELLAELMQFYKAGRVLQPLLNAGADEIRREARCMDAIFAIKTEYYTAYTCSVARNLLATDSLDFRVRSLAELVETYVRFGEGRYEVAEEEDAPAPDKRIPMLPDADGIVICPRPGAGYLEVPLNINETGAVSISIYDIPGRMLLTTPSREYPSGDQRMRIDVSPLQSVIYPLPIEIASGILSHRVLKTRQIRIYSCEKGKRAGFLLLLGKFGEGCIADFPILITGSPSFFAFFAFFQ